jgi:hypothetical protein
MPPHPEIRCALCRKVFEPTSPKLTMNSGTYHPGCWDRKVRVAAEKKTRGERREAAMGATIADDRLAAAVKAGHPKAYCFTCLGTALQTSPSKLREVAQILVLLGGFRSKERNCFHCGRPDNVIVVDEDAGAASS